MWRVILIWNHIWGWPHHLNHKMLAHVYYIYISYIIIYLYGIIHPSCMFPGVIFKAEWTPQTVQTASVNPPISSPWKQLEKNHVLRKKHVDFSFLLGPCGPKTAEMGFSRDDGVFWPFSGEDTTKSPNHWKAECGHRFGFVYEKYMSLHMSLAPRSVLFNISTSSTSLSFFLEISWISHLLCPFAAVTHDTTTLLIQHVCLFCKLYHLSNIFKTSWFDAFF